MSETWNIDEQSGDGRQWWTIVTENGEIVAQAVLRCDAERIVSAAERVRDLEAESARLLTLNAAVAGENARLRALLSKIPSRGLEDT